MPSGENEFFFNLRKLRQSGKVDVLIEGCKTVLRRWCSREMVYLAALSQPTPTQTAAA